MIFLLRYLNDKGDVRILFTPDCRVLDYIESVSVLYR